MHAISFMLLLALPHASTERSDLGEVAVLSFAETQGKGPADTDSWAGTRLADLVMERLTVLGLEVRDRRFLDPSHIDLSASGLAAVVSGRLRPLAALEEPVAPLAIDVEVRTASGRPLKKKLAGKAQDIGKLASEIAMFAARALGADGSDDVEPLLRGQDYPFAIQQALGLARAHFDAGDFRRSMIMYDRASELWKLGAVPEAIAGRLLAELELVGRGQTSFGARADLAPPAAERAEVALRKGDDRESMRALDAYLRYTPEHALRWRVELPLSERSIVLARGARWVVQNETGPHGQWSIDPRTGTVLARVPGVKGLVGLTGAQVLALDGKTLARIDEDGRPRWKVELPFRARAGASSAVELTSGLVGVMGDQAVAWLEVSFGALGQVANDVTPLASGIGGVVVVLGGSEKGAEIALLRPGKKTPVWTANVGTPASAAMTVDVVLVATDRGLTLLRTHDGKPVASGLPLAKGARFIGAQGRHAAVAFESGEVGIFDVLAGKAAATVHGPGAPLSAYTAANGMAILYRTGDILFVDPEGRILDRALVPGTPLDLVSGSPIAPGPVAITTRGLFAYAEIPADEPRMRDVDAMLRLAAVLERLGETAAALRLASEVAEQSSGRVAEAEELRAELLSRRNDPASKSAATAATMRARIAKDGTKPLPRFSLWSRP